MRILSVFIFVITDVFDLKAAPFFEVSMKK